MVVIFGAIFTAVVLPLVLFFVPEAAYRRAVKLNMDFAGDGPNGAHGSQAALVDSPGDVQDNPQTL